MQRDGDGPTWREFDSLERRVAELERHGTPYGRLLNQRLTDVEKRLASLTRAAWSILMVMVVGLVSLLTAITQGVFG